MLPEGMTYQHVTDAVGPASVRKNVSLE